MLSFSSNSNKRQLERSSSPSVGTFKFLALVLGFLLSVVCPVAYGADAWAFQANSGQSWQDMIDSLTGGATGYRMAYKSEWDDAIAYSNTLNPYSTPPPERLLTSIIPTAMTTSQYIFWNPSLNKYQYYTFSGSRYDGFTVTGTYTVTNSQLQAQLYGNATYGYGILYASGPVPDVTPSNDGCTSVGGLAVGSVTSGCVCPSGQYWSSNACTDVSSQACSTVPSSVNTSTSLAGMNLTAAEMDGTTTDVTLNLIMPMLSGRNYTNIYVLAPNATGIQTVTNISACDTGIFTKIAVPSPDDCNDQWALTTIFNRLRGCGFTKIDNTGDFEIYDGVIRVTFVEPIQLGTGEFVQDLTRSSSFDFPFRIKFVSRFTFIIDTSDFKVTSDYQIDFAIVGQNIQTSGSPTVDIQYTQQFPYAVVAWGTPTIDNNQMTPTISAPVVCNTTEYSFDSSNATASTCRHQSQITFATTRTGSGCQFTADQVTLPFTVGCALNLDPADCPLSIGNETTDIHTSTDNEVVFSLSSENFCTGSNSQSSNINNAVTLKSFRSVSSFGSIDTDGNYTQGVEQNAWRYGDYAFYEIQIDGLPVETLNITDIQRKLTPNDADYVTVSSPTSKVMISGSSAWADQQIGGTNSPTGVINDASLGLHSGQGYGFQDYRFALLMDGDLLGRVLTSANRGEVFGLTLKVTCDVSYQTSSLLDARRRRRQATSTGSGSGQIESTEASISAPLAEEANLPSNAIRVSPVLSLGMALLSALLFIA